MRRDVPSSEDAATHEELFRGAAAPPSMASTATHSLPAPATAAAPAARDEASSAPLSPEEASRQEYCARHRLKKEKNRAKVQARRAAEKGPHKALTAVVLASGADPRSVSDGSRPPGISPAGGPATTFGEISPSPANTSAVFGTTDASTTRSPAGVGSATLPVGTAVEISPSPPLSSPAGSGAAGVSIEQSVSPGTDQPPLLGTGSSGQPTSANVKLPSDLPGPTVPSKPLAPGSTQPAPLLTVARSRAPVRAAGSAHSACGTQASAGCA